MQSVFSEESRVNELYIKCNDKILIKTLTKGKEEKI